MRWKWLVLWQNLFQIPKLLLPRRPFPTWLCCWPNWFNFTFIASHWIEKIWLWVWGVWGVPWYDRGTTVERPNKGVERPNKVVERPWFATPLNCPQIHPNVSKCCFLPFNSVTSNWNQAIAQNLHQPPSSRKLLSKILSGFAFICFIALYAVCHLKFRLNRPHLAFVSGFI